MTTSSTRCADNTLPLACWGIASEGHTLLVLEMPTMKNLVSRDTIEKIEKVEKEKRVAIHAQDGHQHRAPAFPFPGNADC